MFNRRQLLGLLAAAPAAAQLAPLARKGNPQRVLVIGGGLAGLCTAFELQQQGHTATVLEAQLHPGGRVRTLRENFPPGLHTEAGAESIPGAHEITRHYVQQFGLTLQPFGVAGARSFYHIKGQRVQPTDKTEWPYELTAEERRLGLAGLRKKYIDAAVDEAVAAGWAKDPVKTMAPWDSYTPGAWLRSKGASAGAAYLLSLGFGEDFGSAASFLLHRLNSMGPNPSSQIEGGNDRLPAEFARRVDIRYGTPVWDVLQNETGVRVTTPNGTLTADRAVCSLPCPAIGRIFQGARLSEAKQIAIARQSYSRTVKVFLQTRSRFWLKAGFNGFVTTDLQIERLTPDPGSDPAGRGALAAYAMGPYSAILEGMPDQERATTAYEQARQIFPELADQYEGAISKSWGADPWQKGSFALHTPGQIGFIDILARPEGRIHFAGEHTSAWTGWMQGALESARRVVAEVNAAA